MLNTTTVRPHDDATAFSSAEAARQTCGIREFHSLRQSAFGTTLNNNQRGIDGTSVDQRGKRA
jgi:hypothetical protein